MTYDTTLVAVGHGDRNSFDLIYSDFYPRVLARVQALLRDRHQAEEVTQEAFLQVWTQASRFDPALGSAANWILRIAHCRAVDRIRTSERIHARDLHFAIEEYQPPSDSVTSTVLLRMDQARAVRALHRLPALHREALVLAYFHGLSMPTISRRLGIPVQTVKSRVRDGLIKLRREFAELQPAA